MQTANRESDWINGVAARLRRQWPTIDAQPLNEMAGVLWSYENLRAMAPDDAADTWLAPVNPD